MTGRLEGSVAFVTGAGGGIGSQICRRYLEEGAAVVGVDLEAPHDSGASNHYLALACDITEPEEVRKAVGKTVDRFGGLQILCNVAGGSSSRDGSVSEVGDEEFWRVIKVDLYGTFLGCRYAIPEIRKAGGGSIINFSSVVALKAITGRDAYTAAKGGVASLTRSMAVEYAPSNIRVNAIAPGLVMTPRIEAMLPERAELREMVADSLLGPCVALDLAEMAVYLGSNEARVVTGQVLSVDSGLTVA